jgi:murein biosynthesis integral membrane protein MurJ
MIKTILLSTLVLNIGLLLGRLSGFVRESIVATTYGTSSQADIVVLMLTVPDLLINILVGGAMGAVLIPEFNSSPNNAKKLLFQTAVFFGIVFTLISTFLYWQSYTLVELLAPGFEDTQTLQASIGLGWVMWLVPLTVLAGIATAYLHSKNKFAVASLGTLIINITIIAGLFLVYFGFGSIFWVAMFALLGGALRLLSQLISVGMKWDPVQSFDSILLNKGILLRYMQAILSGSILLFIPVLARAFASYSGEGGVAIMNYSTRLIEFPLAIAITVFTVTLFPRLSDSFINNKKLYNKLVSYGSQATLGISILIMIALILLSSHYVSVVFNYGHMQTEDLLTIQQLISIGLFVLPLQGMSFFLTAVFHSQKNTKVPLVINSMGLLVFILIYTNSIFGTNHESIMWAMVCSYGLTFVLQLFILKIDDLRIWKAFLNSEFITGLLVSSATLYLLVVWINNANYNSIITLFIAVLAGFISLVILAVFNPEFRVLIKNKVL